MNKRQALAVGIDNYDFAPLSGCVADAEAFVKIMQFHDNYEKEKNFTVTVEKNVPTQKHLRKMIRELFSLEYETVLFYFSGHGIFTENGGFILTPDYASDYEGVSMDEILELANKSKSLDKVILLDCCNSGAFGSSQKSDSTIATIKRGVTILTASNEREKAFQVNGRGVFTNLLLESLEGGAADLFGYITPGGMYSYIDQALGSWGRQRPIFKTNVSRFTILRKIKPQVPTVVIRNLTTYFKTASEEVWLDPSYEYTNIEPGGIKPYATPENIAIFKGLQKLQSIGLVTPVDEEFMYYVAMKSKACKLTALGQHYWRLVQSEKIT